MSDLVRILVVDDDDDIRQGTARLLEKAGYLVESAISGEEALRIIGLNVPDLVLLDHDMPGMDGGEVCRHIKLDPALQDIIVIMISASHADSDQQAEGLEAGADGYIGRPIANRELLARVKAFVRIQKVTKELRLQTVELQKSKEVIHQAHLASLNIMEDSVAARERADLAIKALQESEEKTHLLLNSTAEAIYGLDNSGNCTFCNKSCLRLLGYQDQYDLLGKNMHQQIHYRHADGSLFPMTECRIFQAFQKGEAIHAEDEVFWRADGTSFPVEYWSYPQIKDGVIIGAVVTFLDITLRKQQEEDILRLNEQQKIILDASPSMIFYKDKDNRFIRVNEALAKANSLTKEEMEGKTMWELYYPEAADSYWQDDKEVIASGKAALNIVEAMETPQGTRWVQTDKIPFRNSGGEIIGVIGFATDITLRKQAEDAYLNIFEQSADGIIIVVNGVIVRANEAFCSMHGMTTGEMEGVNQLELIDFHDRQLAAQRISDFINGKTTLSKAQSYQARRKNGITFWVEVKSKKIQWQGKPGIQSITRDITDRKLADEQISRNEKRSRSLLNIMQYRTKSVQEFLDYALGEVISLTASKLGYIYFYHEDRREFVLNTWSKEVMQECTINNPQTCYELDKTGIWGEAVRQRKPVILNNFAADHPLKKGYPQGHAPLTKFLTVPIFKDDQIVAVVGVANKDDDYDYADILQLTLTMDTVWKSVDVMVTENALRENEERLRAITNSAHDAIMMMDNEGNISYWNPAASRILGYTSVEAIGRNLHKLLVPERFLPAHLAAFPEFRQTGKGNAVGKTLELAARRKDGHEIAVALSLSAVKIKDQWHSVGILQDITERKQTEEKLQRSARLLRDTGEMAKVGGWEIDLITQEQLWTDEVYHIHEVDMTYNPTLNKGIDFYSPDSKPIIERAVQRTIKNGEPFDVELEIITAKGNLRAVRAVGKMGPGNTKIIGTFQDITERKKAEDALRQNEVFLNTLLNSIPIPVFYKNIHGQYIGFNRAFEIFFDATKEKLIGKTVFDINPPELAKIYYDKDNELFESGSEQHYETQVKNASGQTRDVIFNKAPLTDSQGKVSGLIGAILDITERKLMEEDLRQATDRLQLATRAGGVGIWDWDIVNNVLVWDDQMFSLYGTKPQQFTGAYDAWQTGIHPEDRQRGSEEIQLALRGEKDFDTEFRVVWQDGTIRYIRALALVQRDAAGLPLYMIGTNWDITDQKKVEDALKKSEERFKQLAEVFPETIFEADIQGNITYANKHGLKIFGYTQEDVAKGVNIMNLLSPDDRHLAMERIQAMIQGNRQRSDSGYLEYHALRKDGSIFNALALVVPIIFDAVPVGLRGFILDITVRKQAEEKLLDINRQLEEATVQAKLASVAKSDFLANMSHEIRTPMNAIIGMADLLWDSPLTTEQHQYVQIFRSAGENLLTLINDILDLSKVESGQLSLEHISYNLADIAEKVCGIMALHAHSRNVELACRINPALPEWIVGDPTRLRQVLMNLLGNAVKFTEKGEILLNVQPVTEETTETTKHFLEFSVRDTGIGIPADKLDSVFEKFTQSDTSITRKYEGTGLGLAISRQLVELMGGSIRVESQPGEGSTFFFTIPLQEGTPGEKQLPTIWPEVDMRGLNILIVDDNDTNRLILRETLTQWECSVTEAANGSEGWQALKKAQKKGQPFQIAILDGQMPVMDGYTLADKIRRTPDFAAVKILMLISERRRSDRRQAKSINTTGNIIKPVKRQALKDALQTTLGMEELLRKSQVPPAPEKSLVADLRPLRILLVEDSEDNRFLVQAYLKNTPYQLEMAQNGQIAVDKFLSAVYDLILMDVQMPVMDGYMATREIRRLEKEKSLRPTPIVALTAHALKEDVAKSSEVGCDSHLTKPIRKQLLLETIKKFAKGGEEGKKR